MDENSVWLHRHARVWTKTQGRARKLVAIQTVAQAFPAADCAGRWLVVWNALLDMPRSGLPLGHCNYVELIDTIFTDVEGLD